MHPNYYNWARCVWQASGGCLNVSFRWYPDHLGSKSYAQRNPGLSRRRVMQEEYDFRKARHGSVIPLPAGKTRITIRLDEDVVNWFRQQTETQGGGNYQTMINQVLRDYMLSQREPLEETLRRVIREELKNYR